MVIQCDPEAERDGVDLAPVRAAFPEETIVAESADDTKDNVDGEEEFGVAGYGMEDVGESRGEKDDGEPADGDVGTDKSCGWLNEDYDGLEDVLGGCLD